MVKRESFLSYNMTSADAANPDGLVPFGRQFDFIGDVETEQMILNDGDESLCLGYTDVEILEDVYVGDMMDYRAKLVAEGNSSRDCVIEVYKVATKAQRMGKEDAKEGDMHWFDEPVLCTRGNVRLVVKKHLQRGEQPSGEVRDPWRALEDFPDEAGEIKENITMRYRMSDRDVFYGGGIVNGARSLTLKNDAANRLMAKVFHNTGHCVEVKKIRFYNPLFAGDYMEYIARIKEIEGKRALIEVRAYKIIEVPENPPYPSSIDVLEDPPLCSVAQFVYEAY